MPAVFVKAIKPPKLKDDVFRLEMLNAIRKTGTVVKKDFQKTTATWKHKPKFEVLISLKGPGPELLVGTDDEIYKWVSRGTEGPYEIWAGFYTGKSDKKALAFKSRFTAKTAPNVIGSFPGSSSGSTVVRPYVVHPGIDPRGFEEAIQEDRQPWYKRQMEMAMSEAAKKSGYGK